ncbi:MAG: hypothetical protein FWF88_03855 [Peptococcaceae bacterium]|nr:hypothetical protein [Peptococcaceae bacterium]
MSKTKTICAERGLRAIQLLAVLVFAVVLLGAAPAMLMATDYPYDIGVGTVEFEPGSVSGLKVTFDGSLDQDNLDPTDSFFIISGNSNTDGISVAGDLAGDLPYNITLDDVDIDLTGEGASAFSISGGATVVLTLSGDSTLTGDDDFAGLQVQNTSVLTIDGTGSLVATGGDDGAGIGGDSVSADAGTITINSGTVTANGGSSGAGIGGGDGGHSGALTINGGTIEAYGNIYAAGIGGGAGGNGEIITINDGSITATGGEDGAGIGSGSGGNGGIINIFGGVIASYGDDNGAGIGGGYGGGSGNITISGGTIDAVGGDSGAGIGGGNGGDGEIISVNGGVITAYGGDSGAGIGGGTGGDAAEITITSGVIEAFGGEYAAGIGSGNGRDGGIIIVAGGTIGAEGGLCAAGIGGGAEGGFTDIVISDDMTFLERAYGGDSDGDYGGGAGIGTGGTLGATPVAVVAGSIYISSGVDLEKSVFGGAGDSTLTAGAPVGTGGADGADADPYDALHTISFHSNEDPDIVQNLTYTVNDYGAGPESDAVLPSLAHIQLHEPAFVTALFDDFWYETPDGGGPHGILTDFAGAGVPFTPLTFAFDFTSGLPFASTGFTFALTTPFGTSVDLYVYKEPKMGL